MRSPALLAVALLATGGVATAAPEPDAKPPNILLLVADDVGWTDASTGRTNGDRGSRYHQTPNLDRLADEGMSFSSAYAFQSCKPTRASLLSGQNPVHHWVYADSGLQGGSEENQSRERVAPPSGNRPELAPASVALPQLLRGAGYRSTHIGKVHGFGPPSAVARAHGFDLNLWVGRQQSVPGKRRTRHYHAVQRHDGGWKFSQPEFAPYARPYSKAYVAEQLAPFANGNDPSTLVGRAKHLTDAIADAARDVIADEARRPGPFFLQVAFHAVSQPIAARADLAAKYAARKSGDLRHAAPRRAALIEGLDQSVGRIVAALDDPDGDGDPADSIRDETLVVLVSDNGGPARSGANRPLKGGRGGFHEGGLRVPLIVRQPGRVAAGTQSDEPVSVTDLYPTFAELAGAALPGPRKHRVDGVSLVPLLEAEAERLERTALYWHFPGYAGDAVTPRSLINRRHAGRRYKLIWSYEELHYTLYDLTDDLGETRDLLAGEPTPEHRAAATRLALDLRNWVMLRRAPRGWVRKLNVPVKPPPLFEKYEAGD